MIRAVAIVLLSLAAAPTVADASARNLLETDYAQPMLRQREERLQRRRKQRTLLPQRSALRRERRLAQRRNPEETFPEATERAARRQSTPHPVTVRRPAEMRKGEKATQPKTKNPGSPNQIFTPTIPPPTLDARSRFLILGHRANVIATVKVTPDNEPVQVRSVRITLTAEAGSVTAFEIFDDIGYTLGTAALDLPASTARDVYTLNLSPQNAYFIEKDDTIVLAARPRLKEKDAGGESGQTVQVSAIDVTAIGQWTSRTAAVTKSGPDFQKHRTALASITTVERDGPASGVFATGADRKIASFTFEARMNRDGNPALTDLTFSVSAPGEVSLGNAVIRSNDSNDSHPCTVGGSTIACASIPSAIGSLQSPRTISLFADVSLTIHPDPFLEITLNRPGRPDSAGDITWTDGETDFDWVEFPQPVATGTSWE